MPRHEKRAARALSAEGLDAYAPVVHVKVRWSDRWKHVEQPMFPGYLFCRFDPALEMGVVRSNRSVLYVAPVGDAPVPIPDRDVEMIRLAERSGAHLEVTRRLEPGEAVAVVSGPLEGLTGTLVRRDDELRLTIKVDMLQQGVEARVELEDVRPLD